jgi:hypothetical protein
MWTILVFQSTKKLDKTRMTIWLVILFLKGAFVELLQAERTDKVLWVELTMHSCDAAPGDWFLTAVTKRSTLGMIVHFTVGAAVMIKKTSSREWLTTFLNKTTMHISIGNYIQLS